MSTDRKALIAITHDVWMEKILEKLFQHCSYKILHVGKATDAIRSVWDVKETINLILTNVWRVEQVGPQLSDQIKKFDLPLILMGLKDDLIQWRGEEDTEAVAYLLFDFSVEDLINIWNSEMESENGEKHEANQEGSAQMDAMTQTEKDEREDIKYEQQLNGTKHRTEFMVEKSEPHKEAHRPKELATKNEQGEEARKGKRVAESQDGEEKEDHITQRKPRTSWSAEMHDKFVEIFELLGPDKAFPKKITELMNHPGLTRESVASHLQKYRLSLRKAEAEKSKNGRGSKKCVKRSSLPPYYPRSDFNTTLGYAARSRLTSGSLPLPPPSPAYLPVGDAQGPYQQQYYSSLSSNQILSQESFNNILERSHLPGSSGSLLLPPTSPAHSPAGTAQRPHQQQYYSSLSSNQVLSQESFKNLLERSQLPGSSGSFVLPPPSPTHLPAGNAQGPYQQQYYSSLSSNQILSQESFNNFLERSQIPGSVSHLQPQPININDPARNCLSGSQNFFYNQVVPDSLMQTGSYQSTVPNLYPSNSILSQNPLRAMNNIPQPHASIHSSGIGRYNASIEGSTAPVRQFSMHEFSGVDDAEFGVLLNEMARAGPQFFPEPNQNQDPNFDQAD